MPGRALRCSLVFAATVAVALAACANLAGIDALEIGACKGGNCSPESSTEPDRSVPETDGGPDTPDTSTGDSEVPCPGTGGPVGVRVGPADNSFCIDSTEVTGKQYKAFIAANVDPQGQPPECVWNESFEPSIGIQDDLPVAGVDWCDALAFCKWSGKYLCGKTNAGKKVGSVGEKKEELNDPKTNQWLLACSKEGLLRYPYGGIQKATACNTGETDSGRAVAAGSMAECNGGYPGVFDMVGNVWEWFDGPCRPDAGLEIEGEQGGPQSNDCWVKGGAYINRGTLVDCVITAGGARRDLKEPYVGFRCCAD